jgi:hypothetical protein
MRLQRRFDAQQLNCFVVPRGGVVKDACSSAGVAEALAHHQRAGEDTLSTYNCR